jgi:hypothetical protein
VIEVLHHGNRRKDLVDNVERYAHLGIPEYFVYDRLHQRILGYRLPDVSARRYRPIVPQGGRYASAVLGLDLAIESDKLRFFYGLAELPGTSDLIGRLNRMMASLGAKADEAEARIEAQIQEAARAQAAEAQAEARALAAEAQTLAALRDGIAALLGARGLACSDADRARLAACAEMSTLQRWLLRATSAGTADEVFAT